MKPSENLIEKQVWSESITNKEQKERVANTIAAKAENGEVIGAGSGSTVYLAIKALADRVKNEGLDIKIIPSSLEISIACSQFGLQQTTLLNQKPDWAFDGADEVDPNKNMIKGRGAALFKEKLLIRNSKKTFILIDGSKSVDALGTKHPIPVEIFPSSLLYVEQELIKLGATDVNLRLAQGKDGPIITENGNLLLDVHFGKIEDGLEKQIKLITGVIESGLFMGYDVDVLIA